MEASKEKQTPPGLCHFFKSPGQWLKSFLELSFLINKTPMVAGYGVRGLSLPGACCEKTALLEHDYFQGMELGLHNTKVYLLY